MELKIFANVAGALPDIRIKLAIAAREAAYDTIPELMESLLKNTKNIGGLHETFCAMLRREKPLIRLQDRTRGSACKEEHAAKLGSKNPRQTPRGPSLAMTHRKLCSQNG